MKEIINYGGRLGGYETIMKEKFEIIVGVLSMLFHDLFLVWKVKIEKLF